MSHVRLRCMWIVQSGSPSIKPSLCTRQVPLNSQSSLFSSSTSSSSSTTSAPSSHPSPPPSSTRKAITLSTDTGQIPWSSLSTSEKATRTAQQSINLSIILVGAGLAVGVSYVLYAEVFSPSSKTAVFNRTVTRIRSDSECVDALVGPALPSSTWQSPASSPTATATTTAASSSKSWLAWSPFSSGSGGDGRGRQIAAYGEGSASSTGTRGWTRNRALASETEVDGKSGLEHMRMRFHVSGPKAQGTVWVHMSRRLRRREHGSDDGGGGGNDGVGEWEYESLALDIEGERRIYLEKREGQGSKDGMKAGKIFGVRWR